MDNEGNEMGTYHDNAIIYSQKYEVEFANISSEIYTANMLAKNIIAQVNDEGKRQMLIDKIIEHIYSGGVITKANGTFVTQHGKKGTKRTNRGSKIYVQWRYVLVNWVILKSTKKIFLL